MNKITSLPVTEADYENTMNTVVQPYLDSRGGDGFFPSHDSKPIHYEKYLADEPEGTVVISHGFTESAEKFREMSYCYLLMGFNVFAIDHRGHGRSWRYDPDTPEVVVIKKFEEYVEDLKCFVDKVVKPASGDLPLYLYAHSMGGAVAVQFLQTYPDVFAKAVLSSPMIQPQTAGVPMGIANVIVSVPTALGRGGSKMIAYSGFNPDATYENSNATSEARFNYYHKKRLADPLLRTSAPSFSWVKQAIRVTGLNLDPARCAKITTPVLLCKAEVDGAVVPEAEDEFVGKVNGARLEQFGNSHHEIYLSVDDTLLAYLQTIEKFLKE